MNRRNFIQTSAVGGGSALLLSQVNCGGPSVSGTVKIIAGGVSELLLLYPGNALLSKIVKLASDFDADWTAGKFDSAKTFFENLDTTVQQVITDLGVTASPRAKLLLASLGIAVRVIASLINEQGQTNPLAAKAAGAQAPATVNRVKQLSNAADADWILKAVQK